MIHVKVAGMSLSNLGFVVLLKGDPDPRTLPIFIGGAEAQAIALWLEKVQIPRPLTHDLFKNVLDCMECRLMRVVIKDVVDNTFYAVLVMDHDGVQTEIDARPSDAIALGLRCSAPLYVSAAVMAKAGVVIDEEKAKAAGKTQPGEPVKPKGSPLEQLKAKLEKAITQENYEAAAKFRDEIKQYEQAHGKN
jgi:bifunctional DNase/RNase